MNPTNHQLGGVFGHPFMQVLVGTKENLTVGVCLDGSLPWKRGSKERLAFGARDRINSGGHLARTSMTKPSTRVARVTNT